jgi:hypothetical protein
MVVKMYIPWKSRILLTSLATISFFKKDLLECINVYLHLFLFIPRSYVVKLTCSLEGLITKKPYIFLLSSVVIYMNWKSNISLNNKWHGGCEYWIAKDVADFGTGFLSHRPVVNLYDLSETRIRNRDLSIRKHEVCRYILTFGTLYSVM